MGYGIGVLVSTVLISISVWGIKRLNNRKLIYVLLFLGFSSVYTTIATYLYFVNEVKPLYLFFGFLLVPIFTYEIGFKAITEVEIDEME